MKHIQTIRFVEGIYEQIPCTPPSTGTYGRRVSEKTITADIEVEVDLDSIARVLGRKAARSKGQKSVDGFVKVKVLRRD